MYKKINDKSFNVDDAVNLFIESKREKLDENINRSCRLIENSVVLQPSDSVSGILEDFLDHIRLVHVVRAKLQIALQAIIIYLLLLRVNELHEIRDAAERCQNGPVKLAVLLDEGESCGTWNSVR